MVYSGTPLIRTPMGPKNVPKLVRSPFRGDLVVRCLWCGVLESVHCLLCVCVFSGDDHQALIWDIQPMPKPIEVPILAYAAEGEINQVYTVCVIVMFAPH